MKNLIFLLITLVFVAISQAQWQEQLDIEYFAYFKRIHFIDENYGWAQATGPYFYTTNGGDNWYLDPNWMDNVGHDIVFVNQNIGFLASNDGIIKKTIDSGGTWVDIQTPTTNDIEKLFFVDENIGWAILTGNIEGKVLHTTDSGDTWEFIEVFVGYCNVSSIFFIDSSTGWGSGGCNSSEINLTINGGYSWDNIYYYAYPFLFNDIYFVNPLKGWVVGAEMGSQSPVILHTADGGETWNYQYLPELSIWGTGNPTSAGAIYSIQFINETDGWLTCTDVNELYGYILITTDGGETWQQQFSSPDDIHDICIIDENHAWAAGGDFIYFNSDIYYMLGIDKYFTQSISISPNPFKTTIKINNSDDIPIDRITITDSLGRICFQTEEYFLDQIDLNYLKNGIYFLTIRANQNYLITKKIIKL